MERKDPKDMTASELLRWAANGGPNEYGYAAASHKLFSALGGKRYSETTYDDDAQNLRALADQIDAEIEAARRDAVKESEGPIRWFRSAIRRGECWPEPRNGEKFRRYLKRCFIQRPLDEKGEPVQFGNGDIDWEGLGEYRGLDMQWDASAVDARGHILATTADPYKIVAVAKTDELGRVKHRAPEVLGADGLPIKVGDVVYELSRDDALTVCEVNVQYIHAKKESGAAWNNLTAKYLTHTPPDTQARIDADARKSFDEYWCCVGAGCDCCPSKIDGKKPKERFDTDRCSEAIVLDLLCRQRQLDARKGGE